MDSLRLATHRTMREWVDIEEIDRVGVWLSGGVDSSTLLHLTCEALGSEKVRAYSVDFGDQNEVERAKSTADWCDVRLLMEEMTAEDSIQLTKEAVFNQRIDRFKMDLKNGPRRIYRPEALLLKRGLG